MLQYGWKDRSLFFFDIFRLSLFCTFSSRGAHNQDNLCRHSSQTFQMFLVPHCQPMQYLERILQIIIGSFMSIFTSYNWNLARSNRWIISVFSWETFRMMMGELDYWVTMFDYWKYWCLTSIFLTAIGYYWFLWLIDDVNRNESIEIFLLFPPFLSCPI